jgi:long-chain fatty acid transport protein
MAGGRAMDNNRIESGIRVFREKNYLRRTFLAAALSLAALLSVFRASALADPFHYINTLIGDRASGLGGAYTAISDDATGLYYNPAGIVNASGRRLSASVNVYSRSTKLYSGAIGNSDWDRKSSALLPNYFGIIRPVGKVKIGFSYAVPDSNREDQDQVFTDVSALQTTYVINFHNDDSTYNIGPSIAAPLSDDLSIGFTLYYHLRIWKYVQNELNIYSTAPPTYGWSNRFYELTEKGFRPVAGLLWSPANNASLGFTLSKVFLYDSTLVQQDICSDTNTDQQGCDVQLSLNTARINAKRKFPLQATIGAAYHPSPELLLSGDLYYYSKVADSIGGNRSAIANVALGAEYALSNDWTVRGGLFTDMAHTPKVAEGKTNQLEHVDLYGISLSVGHVTKTIAVTLGGTYTSGSGKAQIVGGSSEIQDLDVTAWTAFLSSSYSY